VLSGGMVSCQGESAPIPCNYARHVSMTGSVFCSALRERRAISGKKAKESKCYETERKTDGVKGVGCIGAPRRCYSKVGSVQ